MCMLGGDKYMCVCWGGDKYMCVCVGGGGGGGGGGDRHVCWGGGTSTDMCVCMSAISPCTWCTCHYQAGIMQYLTT